jgi:hypothetical protein
MWKIMLIALPLAGCVSTDDNGLRALLEERASRADLAVACKNAARTLVQIARCDVRR